MKHLYAYIVEPIEGRYTNNKKIDNSNLILNTSIENHKFVNRYGKVVQTPINQTSNINIGDTVIVHHNVFRRFYDMRGKSKNSMSYFKEDKYFCYNDQIFLYKQNNKWHTPNGFCFVKPIKEDNLLSDQKEKPLTGVLKHLGSDLRSFNLKVNDLVGFTPNSEYEFVIDNNRMYRVPLNSISIKYDRKGTEVEYNPSWLQSSS
jgi:hypothetical protein|tara:strand:- start:76 stop:684 length:609 start_codon:yes stop_codon:yes gene_type:complete